MAMTGAAPSFYVTGGTLRPDAPSYVERRADRDLYDALSHGEFCYVLHARQMGKSSLMARCAQRLRQAGLAVASLDLQAVGQNLSVEQWYDGLLNLLGQQLGLEDELDDFWLDHARLGPLQRWMAALREVVLARLGGRVALFIDEIDAVRALPFSADEFFAGIRECYNRRVQEPEYARLTFCLLGVASPSDLIRDVRTSPFNIGRRIELTDFTHEEAAPLSAGLPGRERLNSPHPLEPVAGAGALTRRHGEGHGATAGGNDERLLQRILYWTGGHPYLTQRLCQAAATDGRVSTVSDVDRLCEELFFSPRARERDDNLLFVRDRLLRSEGDVASLLGLYAQVRSPRQKVADDETNPLVTLLHLSGIVRSDGGSLKVRNRIYGRVFDGAWMTGNMPGAEVRRLRALAREEGRKRREAEERERAMRWLLYASQMSLAQQAWEVGNIGRAVELVESQRPGPGQEDLRGFEWRYLWRRCNGDVRTILRGHDRPATAVAFSPDGTMLATASDDLTVKLWSPSIGAGGAQGGWRVVASLQKHTDHVHWVRFSPDGKLLVSGSSDTTVRLWDVATRRQVACLEGHKGPIWPVLFSPSGQILASGGTDGVRLWDVATQQEIARLAAQNDWISGLAFSPDGKILATSSRTGLVRLWDVRTRRTVARLKGHRIVVRSLAFSPDGTLLATGSEDDTVRLWDLATGQTSAILPAQGRWCTSLMFSPCGRVLAAASEPVVLTLWDVRARKAVAALRGHTAFILDLTFSPDGKTLASASADGTVRLWDAAPRRETEVLKRHKSGILSTAFSPDGNLLATGGRDGTMQLWDVATQRLVASFPVAAGGLRCIAFSPDGQRIASCGSDDTARLWDVASQREVNSLTIEKEAVLALAFSPDGQMLLIASDVEGERQGGRLTLWEIAAQREVLTRRRPGEAYSVAYSPDGKTLALASYENLVRRWETTSWQELPPLPEEAGVVTRLAHSPDGRLLAVGSHLGAISLWNLAAARKVATFQGHNMEIHFVAFSPDSKTLATGAADRLVKLWNVTTQQEVASLGGHPRWVSAGAFSPSGNILASASADGTLRLWRAATFAETDAPVPTPRSGS
jgi:WD40 repeat protein